MTDAICPTCEQPIDPARAPIARIRGGHVLTYCSQACAAGLTGGADAGGSGDGLAAQVPPTPAAPARRAESTRSKAWYDAGEREEAASADSAERAEGLGDLDEMSRRPTRLGRRHLLAIAGAILVGGMAIAIVEAVSPSTPSVVSADIRAEPGLPSSAAAAPPAERAAVDSGTVQIEPAKLAGQAVEILRGFMQSNSPRLQQEAALALARTGDQEAMGLLIAGLDDQEASPHQRIRIASALSRAGDARGLAVLEAGLKDQRRDLRIDAARALARLGNDSGRNALAAMLRVRTHQVGAAGVLALLRDERGVKLLRDALDDGDRPEVQMRAAVYLGLAGDASVQDRLRQILADGRYGVRAATALAALGDASAVPALREQLTVSSMRVEAAIALRGLAASIEWKPLAVALLESDELGQVTAAEAILILVDEKPPVELR